MCSINSNLNALQLDHNKTTQWCFKSESKTNIKLVVYIGTKPAFKA